jgi:16S rRNA G966 N2-methylase RsmD
MDSNNIDYMNIEYPYQNMDMKFNIKKILKKVRKFKPIIVRRLPEGVNNTDILKFENEYFFICENYLRNLHINSITDFFTEDQRVICAIKNNQSPIEMWKQNRKKIIKKCKSRYKKVTPLNLRETIYSMTKSCNNFRITVILAVLSYFKPKSWLDISAGWGDRLLGALLSNVQYYESADPNLNLRSGYKKIIKAFTNDKTKNNYIVHNTCFLKADLGDRMFDFVFSSPPFFDLEVYSQCENDSLVQNRTNELWMNNFLLPAIDKCHNHLLPGGIFILYIHSEQYLHMALELLNGITEYLGAIYFYDKIPRKMHVWKKNV